MSVPSKDRLLLSQTEKDRLKNPPIDANIRKRNNLIVKEKIKHWLKDANDICFALDHLKDTKIDGVFPDEDIFSAFKAIEKMLDRLNFAPVEGDPHRPFVSRLAPLVSGEEVKLLVRRATTEDLERNWQVQKFVESLKRYYDDPFPKNGKSEEASPAYKKYYKKKEYREMKEDFAKIGWPIPKMWEGEDMEAEEPPK